MKFGSKGLEASTIIGIIVAILVAGVILYILWSKGLLPFNLGITEAECTTYFTRGCQQGNKFDDKVKNLACASFGQKFKGYDTCFTVGGSQNCEVFCELQPK